MWTSNFFQPHKTDFVPTPPQKITCEFFWKNLNARIKQNTFDAFSLHAAAKNSPRAVSLALAVRLRHFHPPTLFLSRPLDLSLPILLPLYFYSSPSAPCFSYASALIHLKPPRANFILLWLARSPKLEGKNGRAVSREPGTETSSSAYLVTRSFNSSPSLCRQGFSAGCVAAASLSTHTYTHTHEAFRAEFIVESGRVRGRDVAKIDRCRFSLCAW